MRMLSIAPVLTGFRRNMATDRSRTDKIASAPGDNTDLRLDQIRKTLSELTSTAEFNLPGALAVVALRKECAFLLDRLEKAEDKLRRAGLG
jgi:hypothetical protein